MPSIGQITGLRPISKLSSAMKLSGFVDVSECKVLELGNQLDSDFKSGLERLGVSVDTQHLERIAIAEIQAKKPAYEVGASSQLALSSQLKKQGEPPLIAVLLCTCNHIYMTVTLCS